MKTTADLDLFIADLRRRAEALDVEARRKSVNAGHSLDEDGTGDEGWAELFSLNGKADGLRLAADLLTKLLKGR